MTREEILQAYEEALEQAAKKCEAECKDAREWCLKKLKEAGEEEIKAETEQ